MNKIDYIKQLKKLIKKYHPDLCNEKYLESKYNEITVKLVNKLNQLKIKENESFKIMENNASGKNAIIKIKDQDYVYYKLGIKYYKNIHPNYFYKRNPDSTQEIKTYDELFTVLNRIFISFKISEYYFKKITEEFPKSPYMQDSLEKIKLLKKLYKSYENFVLEENVIVNSKKFMNEMGLKLM